MEKTNAQKIIGERIKLHRNILGITQEELADRVNLHRTYISSVERGERNISTKNLLSICFEVEINLQKIFDDIKKEDI
jgi:transcriptional regulator with XRE-family HTH domain